MSKKYEAMIIFAGSVHEDNLAGAIDRFVDEIKKFGAEIESTEALGRRQFARVMDKRDHGCYGQVRFSLDPANVAALRDRFRLYEEVYRLRIVARNERIEAAKAKDDARRAAFEAKLAEKQRMLEASEAQPVEPAL